MSKPLLIGGAALAIVVALCCGVPLMAAGAAAIAGQQSSDTEAAGGTGTQLRPDAPVPPQYLAYVLQAGSVCTDIGPAQIAAQIDLESSWNPNAYADSGSVPAMGIAQFTAATWQSWGNDYDGDGTNSPYDPGDAIIAQGHLMCDLVQWARDNLANGRLHGDLLDLAWAAYFDGRGGILAAGGMPASGLAQDYPQQVRDRLAKYAADDGDGLPDDAAAGLPAGYHLPADPRLAKVVSFAIAQYGKPYVFGAAGPNSYDCSGLTMAAWDQVGVHMPHFTGQQVHAGTAVASLAAMQPGDLIFIPGSDGTMSNPGHVGLYIGRGGDGAQYVVQAPHTGDHVKFTPVRSWSNQIAAIRRPGNS